MASRPMEAGAHRPAVRVLHFCKSFSPLSETFLYEYVTATDGRGVEGHVAACIRENERVRPFARVHVIGWPGMLSPRRLGNRLIGAVRGQPAEVSFWEIAGAKLSNVVERLRPDVIHAHFAPAAVAVMDIAARSGVPLVSTFYGYDASRLARDRYWRRRFVALWRNSAAVTVLSLAMRDHLRQLDCPQRLIHVVRLGRDLRRLPFRAPLAPVRNFITVGRLTPKKGHLDCLAAFRILRESHPSATLTIVGGGQLGADISDHISAHGLRESVVLRGELSNDAVVTEMARADAFILASKTAADGDAEGTPTVLIEAQAMGLPCVSTFHAGIPELIPEVNHQFLAKEGDVTELAERLRHLAACGDEELLRIALAGRREVEGKYAIHRSAELLREIYCGVACGGLADHAADGVADVNETSDTGGG